MSNAAKILERFTDEYLQHRKDEGLAEACEGMEFSITDDGILNIRDVEEKEGTRTLRLQVDVCCFPHFVQSFCYGLQKAIMLSAVTGIRNIDLVDGPYNVHLIDLSPLFGGEHEE